MSKEGKIEREPFFKGISTILSIIQKDNFTYGEKFRNNSWGSDDDDIVQEMASNSYRKSQIFNPEKEVIFEIETLASCYAETGGMVDDNRHDMDEFVKFSEVGKPLIEKLQNKYPYLLYFIARINETAIANDGRLTDKDIFGYLKDYISEYAEASKKNELLNRLLVKTIDSTQTKSDNN